MKRSLSLTLVICLVFSLFTGVLAGSASAITYTDVKETFWAYKEIYYLTDKGILEGDGTGKFRPTDNVSHSEFIKMIVATFNLTDTAATGYTNVPTWMAQGRYLEKAKAQGFLLNYALDFNFAKDLTREEAVALVMNYLDFDESLAVSSSKFSDYASINAAYRTDVLVAVGTGIIFGYEDGTFQPNRTLSRSEALAILYRAAGAIYTGSANKAETGASNTNATINRSATLTGITFTGNVYITEDVDSVTFTNCYITGNVIVRGETEVVFNNTSVSNLTVNRTAAEIKLTGTTTINNANINKTADINVATDSTIKTLRFNSGSKNSTVTGTGKVTNISVADSGITTTGVEITEYYIYTGYTATFDGIKYEAGSGKPVKSNITAAYVYGTSSSTGSTITFNVTANTTGTFYVAAWPKANTSLTAAEIVSNTTYSGNYKTYKAASTANTATAISLSVSGSYEDYNVGVVFLPTGITSATGIKPHYNNGTITTSYVAMTTTVPTAGIPDWKLTQSGNSLVVTFDQRVYYGNGTSLTDLTNSNISNYVGLSVGNTTIAKSSYTVSVTHTTTSTVITITPYSFSAESTYYVSIDSNIMNANKVKVSSTSKSIVASKIPTWEAKYSDGKIVITFDQKVGYMSNGTFVEFSSTTGSSTILNYITLTLSGTSSLSYSASASTNSYGNTVITLTANATSGFASGTYTAGVKSSVVNSKNVAVKDTTQNVIIAAVPTWSFVVSGKTITITFSEDMYYATKPLASASSAIGVTINGETATYTETSRSSKQIVILLTNDYYSGKLKVTLNSSYVNAAGIAIGTISNEKDVTGAKVVTPPTVTNTTDDKVITTSGPNTTEKEKINVSISKNTTDTTITYTCTGLTSNTGGEITFGSTKTASFTIKAFQDGNEIGTWSYSITTSYEAPPVPVTAPTVTGSLTTDERSITITISAINYDNITYLCDDSSINLNGSNTIEFSDNNTSVTFTIKSYRGTEEADHWDYTVSTTNTDWS